MTMRSTRRANFILRSLFAAALAAAVAACGAEGDDGARQATAAGGGELGKADTLLAKGISKYQPYIEHRTAVRVGNTVYTHLKLNYGKGKLATQVLDGYGKPVASSAVKAKIRAQFKAYGKIHPALWRARAKAYGGFHEVLVRLDVAPLKTIDKPTKTSSIKATLAGLAKLHAQNLKAFNAAKTAALKQVGLVGGEYVRDVPGSPYVVARLRGYRITQLAQAKAVQMLRRHDTKGMDDVTDSLAISNADDVIDAGTTGDGVRVAVWENGPTNDNNLNIVNSYTSWAGIAGATSDHAENVTGIVHAYAPDAEIYSADSKDLAALDWAIDTAGASAINQSFHRGDEIDDGMSSDDLYKDYKVLHYPWPFISQAAGNWCAKGTLCYEDGDDVTDEFVNHKGYNTISVGNHSDDASTMRASSCFINPTSSHGDRELPELAANGWGVTARGITMSGTSQASPAVVGTAAQLQETAPILAIWPEGVRALLLAGATKNVPSHSGTLAAGGAAADAPNTWWKDVSEGNDAFDGAGALNAQESVRIAGHRYAGVAGARGWDIGKLTDASFDGAGYLTKTYKVKVPGLFKLPGMSKAFVNPLLLRRKVKVALAWDSTALALSLPFIPELYFSVLQLDLDIRVYDSSGNQVAHSLSWDNSYEIVDFLGKAGKTYTIKIHRWPSSSTAGAWTWFGIAWAAR
jgi:hypothetical protein